MGGLIPWQFREQIRLSQCSLIYNKTMWNTISASKLLQKKLEKESYAIHRANLSKVKAVMKISAPIINHKKLVRRMSSQQKKGDQILQIRIQGIKPDPKLSHIAHWHPWRPASSRQAFQDENLGQIGRILDVTTHYPFDQIKKEMKQLNKIRINISKNARRTQQYVKPKVLRRRYYSFKENLPHWNPDTKIMKLTRPKSAFARGSPVDRLQELHQMQQTMTPFETLR